MNETDGVYANQVQELRRGTIVLAILSALRLPSYGYGLLQALDAAGITVDAGTLYPLLRRLEKQELLLGEWSTADTRPRKYYRLSDTGLALYARLRSEWQSTQENLNKLMDEE